MSEGEKTVSIEDEAMGQGDSPIGRLEEDRFRRRPFAEALGAEILAAPAAREHVMGLIGPCGSGKASILNVTVDALGDQAIVVQFNPWMFFGTEVLDSSFFEEVGKQLDRRDSAFKAIAEKLKDCRLSFAASSCGSDDARERRRRAEALVSTWTGWATPSAPRRPGSVRWTTVASLAKPVAGSVPATADRSLLRGAGPLERSGCWLAP